MTEVRKLMIDVVVGARPNFVKAASLVKELDASACFNARLIHTGQHDHPALSEEFCASIGLRQPDIHLRTQGGSHAQQTSKVMCAYEAVLEQELPRASIVIGDVNSTLGAAITAKKAKVPLIHLEAGLRSGDNSMPEEINRRAVDSISDRFWAPSEDAIENLTREGHRAESIAFTGNFMIDSLVAMKASLATTAPPQTAVPPFGLVTLHRPSNIDSNDDRERIFGTLERLAQNHTIWFPAHPRLATEEVRKLAPSVRFCPPKPYREFISMLSQASVVVTDSGGIQEETSYLGIPCLTLRRNTERPITLTHGTNQLVSTDSLIPAFENALQTPRKDVTIAGWDGKAAQRAVHDLQVWLAEEAAL